MPAIVSKTIGTGGEYPDIAAWFAAGPTDCVAADQVWQGQLLNQEHILSTVVDFAGKTSDATRYYELTTAPGASIFDSVAHPLRYDATKGAAIRSTATANYALLLTMANVRLSKLQIANMVGGTSWPVLRANGTGAALKDLLIEGATNNSSIRGLFRVHGAGSVVENVIGIQKATDAAAYIMYLSGSTAINCTLVSLGATLNYGMNLGPVAVTLKNVYVGGCTSPEVGTVTATKINCHASGTATDWTTTPLSAATFQSVANGTHDLRLASGSALINAGASDATVTKDAYGTTRPQGAAYDVGAHEVQIADTTAPTLSNATGTANGSNAANGSVTTNEAGGTLYHLCTPNASETAAAIKAGASQAVTAAGVRNVTANGLQALSSYRFHFVQVDAAGNESAVLSSPQFSTPAAGGAGDTTGPVLSGASATATGATTATGTVGTDEAGGVLYRYTSTAATGVTATTIKAANLTQTVENTGQQEIAFNGLPASTTLYAYYYQEDANGNPSNVARSSAFTTAASSGAGTVTTDPITNAVGNIAANATGLTVAVLNASTLAVVQTFTGETTDANGRCVVSHASLVAGTEYAVAIRNAAGQYGIEKYTAA